MRNIDKSDELDEFDEFEATVLAAVGRDDLGAAGETVLAAMELPQERPQAMERLRTLPKDVRRRLARHCVELYGTADAQERRERILAAHGALLSSRLDLLERDGFETAVLAAVRRDDLAAAGEMVLAAKEPLQAVRRLLVLPQRVRIRLSDHGRTLYEAAGVAEEAAEAAEARERREAALWMYAMLSRLPTSLSIYSELKAMVWEVAGRDDSADCEAVLAHSEHVPAVERLRALPREVRHRLERHCVEVYETAEARERREAALWMRAVLLSPPLEPLNVEELEAVLRVVVERDDLTAACEMVLAQIVFPEHGVPFLLTLPEDVRHRLVERCAELYRTAGTQERRDRVALMHAMLAPGRPDDLMSAERQKFLDEGDPGRVFWRSGGVETAWVELASGGDIPVNLGAALRRYFDRFSKKTELREVVRLLADRHPVLNVGDQWSEHALAELADRPAAWTELVAHAVTATAARPSAAWERKGRALLAEVDTREFAERALSWLALVGAPRTLPLENDFDHDPYNNNAARGLVWLVSFLPGHPRTASGLGAVLEKSLRKVPGVGPGFPKLANACATALCRMEGEAALAELARLTARVTYKSTLNLLEAGLEERAKALGLGREEIEELAVPTYGLSETGRRVVHFGDVRAELAVDDGRAVLRWRNAAGKAVKSAPAAVRRDHSEELKELKAAAKGISAMLTALTKRLDRQFLARREWPSAIWRERYLDHPLVGTLARRLLWTLDGTACGYSDGALRDLSGEPVTGEGTVRLWHPVGRPVEEVLAWRERLEKEGVTQPFKQAHREVYLLTDAERRTGSYSNRFAGHVLRQYPFRSLAAERGWRDAELRMCRPDYYYPPAVRELPEWGLRAEYWVHGEGAPDRAEATDSGAYALLAADQVRFYAIDAPGNLIGTSDGQGFSMHGRGPSGQVAPLPLEEIPAQVFSEILRDVDLFVGVASVGNDPTWQDGGPEGRYQEYWSSYSFGELNETARTRHDLLVRLLPRLAIGDRCHVEGRFLHVKGALHTYKIHLRSGNVLMVPGDRYLCIVPDSVPESSPDTGLPFDGDRMLSVILSKALMLADDTKITDRTVLSQL